MEARAAHASGHHVGTNFRIAVAVHAPIVVVAARLHRWVQKVLHEVYKRRNACWIVRPAPIFSLVVTENCMIGGATQLLLYQPIVVSKLDDRRLDADIGWDGTNVGRHDWFHYLIYYPKKNKPASNRAWFF